MMKITVGQWILFITVASGLLGPFLFGAIYVLYWLKSGYWPPWTLITLWPDLIGMVPVHWAGLARVIMWFLDAPLIVAMTIVCWGIAWFCASSLK